MKSNTEWIAWGRKDPLYAVAAWPGKEKGRPTAWTDEEFYAMGASEWKGLYARWKDYGLIPEQCLEIGCGAGRMTAQLAGVFDKVLAIDISEDQINYAKSHIASPSVEFRISDGIAVPAANGSATAVFSCHVLQHFDSPREIFLTLAEVFRVLKNGGTCLIHFPIHVFPSAGPFRHMETLYRIYLFLSVYWANLKRKLGRSIMRYTSVSQDRLCSEMERIGFADVVTMSFPVAKGRYFVVMARKP